MKLKNIDEIKTVMLICPPNTMPKDSVRRITEPIGLLYIGTMLKEEGFDVNIFDMSCEGYEQLRYEGDRVTYGSTSAELRERLLNTAPNCVGVTCMFSSSEENVKKVCKTVRETMPAVPIVVGGLHPSLYPEKFLETGNVDYVILGEGELRTVKLLMCLNDKKEPEFDGVAYKEKNAVRINPMTERIKDLSILPYPDRTLINFEKYIAIGTPFAPFAREQRVATILTTRGCPNRCNFCSTVHYWGQKLRFRSVDDIMNELEDLKHKYDIREIQFADDNMTANKKFAKELFIRMKELKFKFCTPTGLYFNSLDAELIQIMAEAGAYQLTIAVESASKRVLKDIIHKKVDIDRVKDVIEEVHKYDIDVHGMFIVGFPGEKREEIMATFDFPFKVGFDSVSFFIACPMPGAELYKECEEKGYLSSNYSLLDLKTPNIHIPKDSPDYVMDPDELEKLVNQKTREFNEWYKENHRERWERKFSRYLSTHTDEDKKIVGRVS